jgi:hypothetical protein
MTEVAWGSYKICVLFMLIFLTFAGILWFFWL